MRAFNITLRLVIGLGALAFGIYRFHYIRPDWRSALVVAVGVWFLFRAFQFWHSNPSLRQ